MEQFLSDTGELPSTDLHVLNDSSDNKDELPDSGYPGMES